MRKERKLLLLLQSVCQIDNYYCNAFDIPLLLSEKQTSFEIVA